MLKTPTFDKKAEILFISGQTRISGTTLSAASQVLARVCTDAGYRSGIIEHAWYGLEFRPESLLKAILNNTDEETLAIAFSTTLLMLSKDNFKAAVSARESTVRGKILNSFLTEDDWGWWGRLSAGSVVDLVAQVRTVRPNLKVLIGGSQITLLEVYRLSALADFAIVGQGETALLAVMSNLKFSTPLVTTLDSGVLVVNEKDYPYDGFSTSRLVPIKQQYLPLGATYPAEVARGCIFKCSFCDFALAGKGFAEFTRTANLIRQDLIDNYDTHKIQVYTLIDDTIIDSAEKMELLVAVFSDLPFKVYWGGYFRLDLFYTHSEWPLKLQELGCRGMFFGIETFDKVAGGKVGKGLGKVKILKTLEYFRSAPKIHLHAAFIWGLPHESIESMRETHEWVMSTDLIKSALYNHLKVSTHQTHSKMATDPDKHEMKMVSSVDMMSQHTAFSSLEKGKAQTREWQHELSIAKPKYVNTFSWFKRANHSTVLIQSGVCVDADAAMHKIEVEWANQPATDISLEIRKMARYVKRQYFDIISRVSFDYSDVANHNPKPWNRAQPITDDASFKSIPITVAKK